MVGFPVPGRLDGAELTAPVNDYPDNATPEGVQNTFGNAAEWVAHSAERDSDQRAGIRGGSYADDFTGMRATNHTSMPVTTRYSTIGFRCVRDVR